MGSPSFNAKVTNKRPLLTQDDQGTDVDDWTKATTIDSGVQASIQRMSQRDQQAFAQRDVEVDYEVFTKRRLHAQPGDRITRDGGEPDGLTRYYLVGAPTEDMAGRGRAFSTACKEFVIPRYPPLIVSALQTGNQIQIIFQGSSALDLTAMIAGDFVCTPTDINNSVTAISFDAANIITITLTYAAYVGEIIWTASTTGAGGTAIYDGDIELDTITITPTLTAVFTPGLINFNFLHVVNLHWNVCGPPATQYQLQSLIAAVWGDIYVGTGKQYSDTPAIGVSISYRVRASLDGLTWSAWSTTTTTTP